MQGGWGEGNEYNRFFLLDFRFILVGFPEENSLQKSVKIRKQIIRERNMEKVKNENKIVYLHLQKKKEKKGKNMSNSLRKKKKVP